MGAWWADAGVDMAFLDDPRDWVAEAPPRDAEKATRPAARRPTPAPPPPPRGPAANAPMPEWIGGNPTGWPQSVTEFATWWMNEPSLDAGPIQRRVPPAGPAGAAIMVLVAEPEAADDATLLSGEAGALLDAMLRTMGAVRGETYLASALPRHTPAADWAALGEAGLGALMAHHVALVRPRRLLVFGREVTDLLTPEDFDEELKGVLRTETGDIPLLAGYPLDVMSRRPHAKRNWWRRWLAFSHRS